MNWHNFQTYGNSEQEAFETLCNHLFERYVHRTYPGQVVRFRVINGSGGDGGIEAYALLSNGDIIAIQVKWFRDVLEKNKEIRQIRKSVETARKLRGNIKDYIICVPRDLNSVKFGRGKVKGTPQPVLNHEEKTIDDFTDDIEKQYTDLSIKWWFEKDIENELTSHENEGIQKFWFDREVISLRQLTNQFDLQKAGWLRERYVPELFAQGIIRKEADRLLYEQKFRDILRTRITHQRNALFSLISNIERYKITVTDDDALVSALGDVASKAGIQNALLGNMEKLIATGVNELDTTGVEDIVVDYELFEALRKRPTTNAQLPIKSKLEASLSSITAVPLNAEAEQIAKDANQIGRIFLGGAGTGKTNGLCDVVNTHLEEFSPAIIIKAKGAPCATWWQILSNAMQITGWTAEQILSALEGIAIRNDNRLAQSPNPGQELERESSKVVICVDGLEEDTAHWKDWYQRINESIHLMGIYKRLRFIYSARNHFLDGVALADDPGFNITILPREGDVPVMDVVDRYFSAEHYNIKVTPFSLISGIDSLFALRLFCELYKDQTLTEEDEILTAEGKLLNCKIQVMNTEFLEMLGPEKSGVRVPVAEALVTAANHFYDQEEIEHSQLVGLLKPSVGQYLNDEEVDRLIGFLVAHGILNRIERPEKHGLVEIPKISYTLTYQSIMERIMSDKYVTEIAEGRLEALPKHLLAVVDTGSASGDKSLMNERIVQNIADLLLHEHHKMIGVEGFISEGLDDERLQSLQLASLIKAPADVAKQYKERVNELFFKDHRSRHFIFSRLIFPSCSSPGNYFGADYLHELLLNQQTAFAREKVWLGWDSHDIHALGESENKRFRRFNLQYVIDPNDDDELYLPQHMLHNELPLVYGWALATLDQKFRNKLRIALARWAMYQPAEFELLLYKLFPVNDPQIQEDLASVTLALAGKLRDKTMVLSLANWALENVFRHPDDNRNVIVRQGFRAIVERAAQFGLITGSDAAIARPAPKETLAIIPLDEAVIADPHEAIYPIVHDLAWYVIRRSYSEFLSEEYKSDDQSRMGTFDEDGDYEGEEDADDTGEQDSQVEEARKKEAKKQDYFFERYGELYPDKHIGDHSWAMAAAIAYMKSLGFDRTDGNTTTRASHGSKSNIYTLEEKYTWLAVHYLKGYLSDFLPRQGYHKLEYVTDYFQIVDMPNPGEYITADTEKYPVLLNEWLVKEPLAPETANTSDFDEAIKVAVEAEPIIDPANWLQFKSSDFLASDNSEEWLAIYNYTSLHDSKTYVSSRIDIRACLIKKGDAGELKDLVKEKRRSWFVEYTDRMQGSPDTTTYSNPLDVIWMTWIGEIENSESYYPVGGEVKQLLYSITNVTYDSVDGETQVNIPSKVVRELLGIVEKEGSVYLDQELQPAAYFHAINGDNNDRQEIILVRKNDFLTKAADAGFEPVWFIEILSSKNALNKQVKTDNHPMKCRKYLVYFENGQLVAHKFWDARFSNQRDEED